MFMKSMRVYGHAYQLTAPCPIENQGRNDKLHRSSSVDEKLYECFSSSPQEVLLYKNVFNSLPSLLLLILSKRRFFSVLWLTPLSPQRY
jgi:hypothetical protein